MKTVGKRASIEIALGLIGWCLPTAASFGDVLVFEGTSFPDEDGWERNMFCTPERWLADGWFVVACDPGECSQQLGDFDDYNRWLPEFDGPPSFFVEWRAETDGPSSEFVAIAPASLTVGSLGPVNYQFVFARDLIYLYRDFDLPVVYVDLIAGVSHTYRLELYGADVYIWYIDGEIVDSGIPVGPYRFFPIIGWNSASWMFPSTTRWDYIRLGTIPIDGSGDFDNDGLLDTEDFYFFEECVHPPGVEAGPGCRFADFDDDSDVDFLDFAAFQVAFTGPP